MIDWLIFHNFNQFKTAYDLYGKFVTQQTFLSNCFADAEALNRSAMLTWPLNKNHWDNLNGEESY